MKTPPRHNSPDCLACTDPAQFPAWLAAERDRAAELGQRARDIRVQAKAADAAALAAVMEAKGWQAIMAAQREQQRLHGQANGLAQSALIIRGHADRVEAAHPRPVETVPLPSFEGQLDLFGVAS